MTLSSGQLKREPVFLLDIIRGMTSVVKPSQSKDLPTSKIEELVDKDKRCSGNALRVPNNTSSLVSCSRWLRLGTGGPDEYYVGARSEYAAP
jgi:hypothetical protein